MSKVIITPKRQSTGIYGTVQAYEPVEVDSELAKKLLKTGNWINGKVDKKDRPQGFAFPTGANVTERLELVLDAKHLSAEVERLGKLAADLDTRQTALDERQTELDGVASAQTAEGERLTALAEDLGGRDKVLTELGTDLDTRQTTLTEGEARLAADREAHENAVADAAAAAKAKK